MAAKLAHERAMLAGPIPVRVLRAAQFHELDPANPDRDLTETGALLPGPDATLGGPTFEAWLEAPDRQERKRHARHQDPSLQR